VLAARMSLSFPGLISAVPLYARDFTLKGRAKDEPRLCLFSDGGLSSNFPIHFFDRLWPSRPTFGVALDAHAEERHGADRVWMPGDAGGGVLIPISGVTSLGGFLMRLIDAAKDWQDNLQSVLPGYRERIVHIALKADEGGLNVAMPEATVRDLAALGAKAGARARDSFDLDEHRWRRFLTAMARIEQTLDELATAYDGRPSAGEPFECFLKRYATFAESYEQEPARLREMLRRAEELAQVGRRWRDAPTVRDGAIPKPETDLRMTPKP
jgi:predicted acylesterase/phospholipase RssA